LHGGIYWHISWGLLIKLTYLYKNKN
jgi:hypothetical protein